MADSDSLVVGLTRLVTVSVSGRIALIVHVLCVASIDHLYRVAIDSVGVVPLAGVRHIIACPSFDCWPTARQRTLDSVDGEESIAHVTLHILIRVGVAVLLGHVLVERSYLGGSALGIEVLILLHLRR